MKVKFYDADVEDFYWEQEINDKDAKRFWINFGIEENFDELTPQKQEEVLQARIDIEFNKPEINNDHKFHRHRGYPASVLFYAQFDDDGDIDDSSEPNMSEVINPDIYGQPELKVEWQKNHDDVCSKVRSILAKKPHWAEAFIVVCIDGMRVNDYARSIQVDPSAVSHWLSRAKSKLKKEYVIPEEYAQVFKK